MEYKILPVLMERDGMDKEEALELINEAKEALNEIMESGDIFAADDICGDFFGLEPDYMDDLIYNY